MGTVPGKYLLKGCDKKNKRLFHSKYRNEEKNKKRRKIIRGIKKQKADKDREKERTQYKEASLIRKNVTL